ncbi:MAG: hypothetical protein ACRCYU_03065, partial [Nocardioides sp.]
MKAGWALPIEGLGVTLRVADEDDVLAIVELLSDDQLGATRDGVSAPADLQPYLRAFREVDADDSHLLLVCDTDGEIVA